ncbi:MAG: SufE family protein [Puniceicoccales bacterium]|jgi:cysteine desulfuration protein SufE|nr:SufE family protein [Puniceicoccales bacterium]
MSILEKRQAILDELSPFEDPRDRFQYIIDRAKSAPGLPEEQRLEQRLIEGCTSQLWLVPSHEDGVCHFCSDADAVITKGIATLVCDFYDGATPAEILSTGADFLAQVGLTQHLSPNRRNGLSNLVKKIHAFAQSVQAQ